MDFKYKGIDLEKIKQVQEVKFPHVHVDPEEVKLSLNYIALEDSLSMTAAQVHLQNMIEAHQRKYMEDHDMFIICEMAKLFLEEKEKQKKVLKQIEELRNVFQEGNYTEAHCVDRCHDGCVDTDCTACVLGRIIEIIKEKVGV